MPIEADNDDRDAEPITNIQRPRFAGGGSGYDIGHDESSSEASVVH
jgi:hypothetical protein